MKVSVLLGFAASVPLLSYADSAVENRTESVTYTPADFAQFAPRTALDMVIQIPGFTISGSEDGARGFGQASENVLINGQRISSKSTTAQQALARIPAVNVATIEIVDGASLDVPGLSGQVANITASSAGISGTWSFHQRYRENLPPVYDWIEASISGQSGDLSWTVGLESIPGRGANSGRENITDGSGQLIEFREESLTSVITNPSLSANLTWKPKNGHIANLNIDAKLFELNERETSNRFAPDDLEIGRTQFQFSEDFQSTEFGADYEFGLGSGRLKLIGLQRNEHFPQLSEFRGADNDGSNHRELIFADTTDKNESILRTEYSWNTSAKTDWQVSAEGAYNRLENEAALFESLGGAPLTPVDIGDSTVKVEEVRGEAFITHGRQVTPKFRVQLSVGAEISEIKSDGANGQTRQFTRPKGSASASWQVNDKLTVNSKIERLVGQLDFGDFVSSVDVNQGDDQTGNVDIVPQQSWRGEVEAERKFGRWGAGTATVFGESLEDIADQVPIGTGEGPGNLDSGTRFGVELEGTLKFDPLGWKGAQLQYEANYHKSAVDDPVTGESRRINGDLIHYYRLEFRHDIADSNWAWGLTYEDFADAPRFRRDSRLFFENKPGFMWGFIEHKDILGMTGTVFLANLTDQDNQFTRAVYAPDRTGTLVRVEDRTRNFGNILTLRLKGNF